MVFVVASSMADDAQRGDRDQTDDNNCTGANEEYKDCGNACEPVLNGSTTLSNLLTTTLPGGLTTSIVNASTVTLSGGSTTPALPNGVTTPPLANQ
ncbi:unnamed protein product [Sphagnum balticum]